ncbi:hypothetical protein IFM89_021989 [Coptis chinensis]|uniref:Metallophosphoesterase 1 n=1 Tax=Coptis chinensis TaxID=261450 RepID=A0A835I492_9MAGN|nr:hypothetical protein IFM89_021989 [Coptis chinensis]
MIALKWLFPLVFVIGLAIFEERVSIPSCEIVPRDGVEVDKEELRVMMVANLLLMGSEAGYMNMYFRDSYMAKFLKKSFDRLQPDMLIVLGDVSARGSELTKSRWLSVLQQFQRMLGPFLGLPLHIILGDRDIGECSKLDLKSVRWIASNMPGLDSSGCGAFEMSNVSFVSLNAVAMLCGNNDLRFSIEKVIERENSDLQTFSKDLVERENEPSQSVGHFGWRVTDMPSGSGPVLLLHFPLHRSPNNNCKGYNTLKDHISSGPDESLKLLHNRIIFSAHSNGFCDHTHKDGTREVTVPSMTWGARDDPGFVVATFGRNKAVTVSQCSLARESNVIMAYIFVILLLISTTLVASKSQLRNLQR